MRLPSKACLIASNWKGDGAMLRRNLAGAID